MMEGRHKIAFEDLCPNDRVRDNHVNAESVFAASTYPMRSQLPINLVLLIISHLDDTASLASVTRASRLLYYLTIPRLYEHVALHAYPVIRYVNEQPEGYGGGSPFSMGLDALVSSPNNVAQYVRQMTLCGQWRETDTHEFEKGRVPDNTMMLNIVVRAAISRAERLERFNWTLNTKPMKTVYQGLALRNTLTHLRLQFPSSRIPRPAVMIPAIPSLKTIAVSNMDPLCYNDDISLLISEARGLETLKLHWSRRMRSAREPSVYLRNYVGRLADATHKLRPRDLQFFNMFARNDGSLDKCFNFDYCESIAFLNCMEHDDPTTVFVDNSWLFDDNRQTPLKNLKRLRAEKVDKTFPKMLKQFTHLEEMYIVSGKLAQERDTRLLRVQSNGHDSSSPGSMGSTPEHASRVSLADVTESSATAPRPNTSLTSMDWSSTALTKEKSASPVTNGLPNPQRNVAIASDFIAILTAFRGQTMRKILLPDNWQLGPEVVLHLAASCPHLEQLGVAMDVGTSLDPLRAMLTLLPKLTALRLLLPHESETYRALSAHADMHYAMLESETWRAEYDSLVWLGMGNEIARLCGREKAVVEGREVYRGLVRRASWHDVRNVEIFALDNLDE